jgi:hypothetical protein
MRVEVHQHLASLDPCLGQRVADVADQVAAAARCDLPFEVLRGERGPREQGAAEQ